MKQMKVSTGLAILIGTMAVLVYSTGALGRFGITYSNERLQSVYEDRAVPATELGEIGALLLVARLAMNAFGVTPTPELAAQEVALIQASLASVDKKWQAYAAKPRDAQEAALVQAFAAENAKLLKEGFERALAADSRWSAPSGVNWVESPGKPLPLRSAWPPVNSMWRSNSGPATGRA